MESGQVEESKDSSSEESDRLQIANDVTGTGRFYACVFCKRGFSTAQALGGHMNIHRRDRARQQTPPSISNRPGHEPAYSGFPPQQSQNQPSNQSIPPDSPTNYHYVPSSTSGSQHVKTFHGDSSGVLMPPRQLSLFGEDLSVGASSQARVSRVKDGEEEKKDRQDDELDLELRLGPEP
ncbi:hypothetical protein AAC387_Pa11g2068 [Persea americana]